MSAEAVKPCRRGTSNTNSRGNASDRRRRREWLVENYRADVDVIESTQHWQSPYSIAHGEGVPACRCFRCGRLLTAETVTVDRIIPGAEGGTYGGPVRDQRDGRTNVRPACQPCQSETGGALGAARKAALG